MARNKLDDPPNVDENLMKQYHDELDNIRLNVTLATWGGVGALVSIMITNPALTVGGIGAMVAGGVKTVIHTQKAHDLKGRGI